MPAVLEAWFPGQEDGDDRGAVAVRPRDAVGQAAGDVPRAESDLPANTPTALARRRLAAERAATVDRAASRFGGGGGRTRSSTAKGCRSAIAGSTRSASRRCFRSATGCRTRRSRCLDIEVTAARHRRAHADHGARHRDEHGPAAGRRGAAGVSEPSRTVRASRRSDSSRSRRSGSSPGRPADGDACESIRRPRAIRSACGTRARAGGGCPRGAT